MPGCDLVSDGVVPCACRDCMELAIGKRGEALCHACEAAECEGDAECNDADYAYVDED